MSHATKLINSSQSSSSISKSPPYYTLILRPRHITECNTCVRYSEYKKMPTKNSTNSGYKNSTSTEKLPTLRASSNTCAPYTKYKSTLQTSAALEPVKNARNGAVAASSTPKIHNCTSSITKRCVDYDYFHLL